MKIFKYPVIKEAVDLPRDAEILSVGVQDQGVFLWALVDPDAVMEEKRFYVYGTGHEVEDRQLKKFIGTIFQGQFVWHVFQDVGPQ